MTNQRWILIGLGLTFAGLAAAGCKPANPIIGKWTLTQNMFGVPITVTREFRADGTETMHGGSPGALDTTMTYTADGSKLTEAVTSVTMDGKTITVDPSHVPANSPKNMTETYTLNGNTLTISNSASGASFSQAYNRETQQ